MSAGTGSYEAIQKNDTKTTIATNSAKPRARIRRPRNRGCLPLFPFSPAVIMTTTDRDDTGSGHRIEIFTANASASLRARRWLGGIQALESCTVNAIAAATSSPTGCGNHHTKCRIQATRPHHVIDQILTRLTRENSACRHQARITNREGEKSCVNLSRHDAQRLRGNLRSGPGRRGR